MADKVEAQEAKSKPSWDEKGVLAALPLHPARADRRAPQPQLRPRPKSTTSTAASRAARSTATEKPAAKQGAQAAAKPRAAPAGTTAAAACHGREACDRREQGRREACDRREQGRRPDRRPPRAGGGEAACRHRQAARHCRQAARGRDAPQGRRAAHVRATQAAEAAAEATDGRAAGAVPLQNPARPGRAHLPAPGRGGAGSAPAIEAGAEQESGRPSGTELAATAVRAAGEIAQLGITIGGPVLKGVAKRHEP